MRKLHEALKNKAAKAKNCLRIRKKTKQRLAKDRKRRAGFKIISTVEHSTIETI